MVPVARDTTVRECQLRDIDLGVQGLFGTEDYKSVFWRTGVQRGPVMALMVGCCVYRPQSMTDNR